MVDSRREAVETGSSLGRSSRHLGSAVVVLVLAMSIACGSDTQGVSSASDDDAMGPAAQTALEGSGVVFREHRVTDPGMNDQLASTLLVPEGWKVEGGLTRPAPQYFSNPVLMDLAVKSPDGRQVRFFPSLSFEFGNAPGELLSPTSGGNFFFPLPDSPGDWFLEMARRAPAPNVKNLRVVSEEVEEALTARLRQQNAMAYRMIEDQRGLAAQTGVGSDFDTQATVLTLQYDESGATYEETILMAWQYWVNSFQGSIMGGAWSILQMISVRGAPETDYTHDPVLMAVLQSIRTDPVWQAEMNRYWAEYARIRQRGNQQRRQQSAAAHQKRMQALNETSDIIAEGYRRRSAIQDSGHAATIDSIHEVTPYATSSGETVKLPSFYDHVYSDGNGRYLLHNDALYDPNSDSALNSSRWERVERR